VVLRVVTSRILNLSHSIYPLRYTRAFRY
jgi:hypothetical protein